jgi:hypothetical protein
LNRPVQPPLSFKFANLQQLLHKDWQSDARWHNNYNKLIPLIGFFCFEAFCRKFCIFAITDLIMLNKCSLSAPFCSVIMHIFISAVSAVLILKWISVYILFLLSRTDRKYVQLSDPLNTKSYIVISWRCTVTWVGDTFVYF